MWYRLSFFPSQKYDLTLSDIIKLMKYLYFLNTMCYDSGWMFTLVIKKMNIVRRNNVKWNRSDTENKYCRLSFICGIIIIKDL